MTILHFLALIRLGKMPGKLPFRHLCCCGRLCLAHCNFRSFIVQFSVDNLALRFVVDAWRIQTPRSGSKRHQGTPKFFYTCFEMFGRRLKHCVEYLILNLISKLGTRGLFLACFVREIREFLYNLTKFSPLKLSLTVYYFYTKISSFTLALSKEIVLDSFYLRILLF